MKILVEFALLVFTASTLVTAERTETETQVQLPEPQTKE